MNNFSINLQTIAGFPVFQTVIEANYISKKGEEVLVSSFTSDEEKALINLSKDPNIAQRVKLL